MSGRSRPKLPAHLASLVLAAAGCGGAPAATDGAASTTSSGSGTTNSAITRTASSSTGATTSIEPDAPPPVDCDPWEPDCPAGQKCSPTPPMPGALPNDASCVPLADPPVAVGDPCTIDMGVVGYDDCAAGALCVRPSYGGGGPESEGVCVALCAAPRDAPVCPEGQVCSRSNGTILSLCKDRCDPLARDCSFGACYGWSEGFLCSSEGPHQYGEPCGANNDCLSGLSCEVGQYVPDCPGSSCCTAYCDLRAPSCPGADRGQTCLAEVYGKGPNDEHVGICGM